MLVEFENEVKKVINETKQALDYSLYDMTLREAVQSNQYWINKRNDLSNYESQISKLPNTVRKSFVDDLETLRGLKRQFDSAFIIEKIIIREIENYGAIYNEILADFTNEKEKLDSNQLALLQGKINTIIQELKEIIHYRLPMRETFEQYLPKFSELQQQVSEEYEAGRIKGKILEQIKQFTPGIQVLLARISELTTLDKIIVEKSLLRLLNENPDLGSYDKLSQVFIPGKNLSKEINRLILPQFSDKKGIVIDGNNVAWDEINKGSNEKPKASKIVLVVEKLQKLTNFKITAIVSAKLRHDVSDSSTLEDLINKGVVIQAPARRSDDFFIISHALKTNSLIISNDQFRDWKEVNPELAKSIEENRISFKIIDKIVHFDEKIENWLKSPKN